jgi:hypothetical protein
VVVAAISADLNPYEMGVLEMRNLPLFAKYPGAYIEVRNHILKVWQQDVNSYVTIAAAVKDLQVGLMQTPLNSLGKIQMLCTPNISILKKIWFYKHWGY